ncbi:anti-sigma factor domain-containing protein [Petrachloros mirabilis]
MTHEELEEAVPLYAVGALDRAERRSLEAHLLAGCPSCHDALKDYQFIASLLPLGLSPLQASRSLKAKIMAARNPEAPPIENSLKEQTRPSLEPGEWLNHLFPPAPPARTSSLPWIIGVITLLAVGIGGYVAWTYTARLSEDAIKIRQLEDSLQEKSSRLAGLRRELENRDNALAGIRAELQRRSDEVLYLKEELMQREAELETASEQISPKAASPRLPQDELAGLLRRPDLQAVTLSGSEIAKRAGAMLLYDERTKKVWLYFVNLPECPSGTTYQLWAMDPKPVSIGTFLMEHGQTAHLLVKRLPGFSTIKKFAVSLEPSGGRLEPSGPFYLVSETP